MSDSIPYDVEVETLDGNRTTLEAYRDKVLLIVNTASKCGFTPQYSGLEKLYREHRDAGLVVLGFPCNQFMQQEPGDAAAIREFCSLNYDVTFPLFARIDVNGPATHPLYQVLKRAKKGLLGSEAVKLNFTKFLVGRDGRVLGRYAPNDSPESLAEPIRKALA
jgi:glutathione peroxidase